MGMTSSSLLDHNGDLKVLVVRLDFKRFLRLYFKRVKEGS